MRFTSALLFSVAAAVANAQAYFTMSTLPQNIAPGTNYDISWLNGQGTSTVTIFLVQGSAQALTTVMSIASGQPHNGTLSWSPSASLSAASNYAFKIVDDSNPNNYNYSAMFAILTSITSSNTQSIASTTPVSTSSATGLASTASGMTTTGSSLSGASSSVSSAVSSSSSSSRASSVAASATSTSATRSTTTSPSASVTAQVNGARTFKAGGLLAVVAAVMMAL